MSQSRSGRTPLFLLFSLPLSPLLPKYSSTHLQYRLKPLSPPSCILTEPIDRKLLDTIADLLPPPTQRCDFRLLSKQRLTLWMGRRRLIDHRLLHAQGIRPGQICRTHGDFFGGRVDVGCFMHVRDAIRSPQQGADPFGSGLTTGD